VATIGQADIGRTVDELERLLHAVPVGYNPTNMVEVVEHHHRAAELVTFLRDQRVVETLAMLAGGDMVVLAEEPAPEPDPYTSMIYGYGEPESIGEMAGRMAGRMAGEVPLPLRIPGQSRDGSGRLVAEALGGSVTARAELDRRAEAPWNVSSVSAAIDRTRSMYAGLDPASPKAQLIADGHVCPVCGRTIGRFMNGSFRPHGPRANRCYGGPVRTVVR
jgi:hypothetical protein